MEYARLDHCRYEGKWYQRCRKGGAKEGGAGEDLGAGAAEATLGGGEEELEAGGGGGGGGEDGGGGDFEDFSATAVRHSPEEIFSTSF